MTRVFRDRESDDRASASTASRGYTDKDVSLLMSDDTRTRCFPKNAAVGIHLKKMPEGTMIMHFPPAALQGLKKGDTISVDLALTTHGPRTT